MRKEVIFAIVIGLILGTLLVYGVFTANKSVTQLNEDNPVPTPTLSASPSKPLLSISSPFDGSILNIPTATISGMLREEATIVILTENNEIVVPLDDLEFNQQISLIKGGNLIQITAITSQGERSDEFLNLVYTTNSNEPKEDE